MPSGPVEIKGDAQGDEEHAEVGFEGAGEVGLVEEPSIDEKEQDGGKGIAPGAVGAGQVGAAEAEDEHGQHGQRIEATGGENHEVGQQGEDGIGLQAFYDQAGQLAGDVGHVPILHQPLGHGGG